MTNTNYEELQYIAEKYGLKLISTTDGVNGYPSHLSYAIIGFENFDMLEKVKNEMKSNNNSIDVDVVELHKRDGWNLWERSHIGGVYKDYDMMDIYSSKDYPIYTKEDIADESEFIDTEVTPMIEGCDSVEEIHDIVTEKGALFDAIKGLRDDEFLIDRGYGNFDNIAKKSMEYYYDTNYYSIGLMIIE